MSFAIQIYQWVSECIISLSICDTNSNDGIVFLPIWWLLPQDGWMDPWMDSGVLLQQLNEHITVNVSYWSACVVSVFTQQFYCSYWPTYLLTYLPTYLLTYLFTLLTCLSTCLALCALVTQSSPQKKNLMVLGSGFRV